MCFPALNKHIFLLLLCLLYIVHLCFNRTSEDNLRSFLEGDILTRYNFLFKQTDDGGSPDGKTPLKEWVGKMLTEMQQSIESHISAAMKANKTGAEGSQK